MAASPVLPRNALRLRRSEKLRLAVEIVRTYVFVRWWLRRIGLTGTLSKTRSVPATRRPREMEVTVSTAIRLGQVVEKTLGALPLDSRCLIRSLVLTRILARRGADSKIVLAARSKPFAAHSWVERSGVALLPTGSGFHRLAEV